MPVETVACAQCVCTVEKVVCAQWKECALPLHRLTVSSLLCACYSQMCAEFERSVRPWYSQMCASWGARSAHACDSQMCAEFERSVCAQHAPATRRCVLSVLSVRSARAWYSQMCAAASNVAGSCCFSQSALGTIHSADTGPVPSPFTRSAASPLRATCPRARVGNVRWAGCVSVQWRGVSVCQC